MEDGQYEIRLRRWPEEADLAIDAPLAPGAPVPGANAFRTTPGKAFKPASVSVRIGDIEASKPVAAGAKEVAFNLKLPAGKTQMSAVFKTASGEEFGAYYAYVTKK